MTLSPKPVVSLSSSSAPPGISPRRIPSPALFNLYRQGFLHPDEVHIFGYARTKISDEELRNRIRGYLASDKSSPEQSEDLTKFLQLV
ncbi:hypothetical protein MLD38_001067 [Melastoma candidum]|uniref:Uncharacterized protein n=1 Tax=Melastoma candidum TaxID=119954 RepID=A0ACB9SCG8_9MYRT|nr:hypothetical protein MLD38_001067 [Melastoma candidum]